MDDSRAVTSAPLCDARSGEGWQRRGEVLSGLKRGISIGIGFMLTLGVSAVLAVAVTGTMNTYVTGAVMDANSLNTNFASLKTAIESIPNWKSSGTSAYYTDGNVGIGTNSPTNLLDVAGTAQIKGSSSTTGLFVSNAGNVGIGTTSIISSPRTLTVARPATTASLTNTGFIVSDFTNSTMELFQSQTESRWVSNVALGLTANNSAGTPHLYINTAGAVGIGTSAPESGTPLSLNSGGVNVMRLTNASAGGSSWRLFIGDSGSGLSNKFLITYVGSAGGGILGGDAYNMMTFDKSTGNVGIGTTSPSANFQVVGTTLATAWSTSDERYKKNIQQIDNPVEKIMNLRGVNYEWKREEYKDLKFKE
ncbi:MAG TPA: tail fiber domain-containing protein, partial [Leptospiraceae bacterium]|nr:tail fiber domain-containing protein [Leptospiraceae bacterium]HNN05365.1 tail fiber domain-containing protein [Leptospiraceae bacterium]